MDRGTKMAHIVAHIRDADENWRRRLLRHRPMQGKNSQPQAILDRNEPKGPFPHGIC
jgi:hypothetical protein